MIFRAGSPQKVESLKLVSATTARCVVLMSVLEDPQAADALVLRIVIALTVVGFVDSDAFIVAEVRDAGEMDAVIQFVGGDILETVQSNDLNTRVALSAVQQPGITKAFDELLGFDGDEFYVRCFDEIVGKAWSTMLGHFPSSIPIGIKTRNGDVVLAPPSEYLIEQGDALIVISEDSLTFKFEEQPPPKTRGDAGRLPEQVPPASEAGNLLICGAGENLRALLLKLPFIFDKGMEVSLLNKVPLGASREKMLAAMDIDAVLLRRMRVTHVEGDPSKWFTLRDINIKQFNAVIIVSDDDAEDNFASDSRNLSTILLLRNHASLKESHFNEFREFGSFSSAAGASFVSGWSGDRLGSMDGSFLFEQAQWRSVKGKSFMDRKPLPSSSFVNSPADPLQWGLKKRGASISETSLVLEAERLPIFVEIRDTETQDLIMENADVSKGTHFLVSNKLVSKVNEGLRGGVNGSISSTATPASANFPRAFSFMTSFFSRSWLWWPRTAPCCRSSTPSSAAPPRWPWSPPAPTARLGSRAASTPWRGGRSSCSTW